MLCSQLSKIHNTLQPLTKFIFLNYSVLSQPTMRGNFRKNQFHHNHSYLDVNRYSS